MIASVMTAKNLPEQAMKSIKTAIERQPKNPLGYTALAEFHLRRKEYNLSLEAIKAGLREQPGNPGLELLNATVLGEKGDHDAAIQAYEAIVLKQPGTLVAANNLADLLSNYRNDKESLERAQAVGVVLRGTNLPQFKDTVGWLAYLRGDVREAVRLLEEAANALPSDAQVRYHLGMSYLKAGSLDKAHEQLKKASELGNLPGPLNENLQAALKEASAGAK
jgi:tetratricopeptide (TPR) repeat protein